MLFPARQYPSAPDGHYRVIGQHAPGRKANLTVHAYKLSVHNVSLGNAGCNIFCGVYSDVIRKNRGRSETGRSLWNLEQKGEI